VKLVVSGLNNTFVSGPLTIKGVTLWVDAGVTLYASRDTSLYGAGCTLTGAANACTPFLTVTGTGPGLVGAGVVDGQGGEPLLGETESWWDVSDGLRASNGSSAGPALVEVNASSFVMHDIRLHNSSKIHVKLSSQGFVVWGVELLTPSSATNSQGTALSSYGARNTDGIDPGGSNGATDGFIVCSKISVGDDQIAITANDAPADHLTVAHNNFGTGHGMSIGSETTKGVSNISVYDLTIDGSLPTGGAAASDVNGIRIKSDAAHGGLVTNVTYSDICVRDLYNPILLNPMYSTASGTSIPTFSGITIQDFHALATTVAQTVTLAGYDASHLSTVTLNNVVLDTAPVVTASFAGVTLGPGAVSFTPTGASVTVTDTRTGSSTPASCTGRWVTF
jgi:polygalacturonase